MHKQEMRHRKFKRIFFVFIIVSCYFIYQNHYTISVAPQRPGQENTGIVRRQETGSDHIQNIQNGISNSKRIRSEEFKITESRPLAGHAPSGRNVIMVPAQRSVEIVNYTQFFLTTNRKVRDMDNETFLQHYENMCLQQHKPHNHPELPLCPCIPPALIGQFQVNTKLVPHFENLLRVNPEVTPGGEWRPQHCVSRDKVAVIIPYRDRPTHLSVLLKYLHPLLKRQLIHYRVFVVEQKSPRVFNKGAVMNSGFQEVFGRYGPFDCVVFHDVDTIPQHDWNFYTCANSPRHVGAYLEYLQYHAPYGSAFGGVTLFAPDEFRKANGFTSEFFGWGGEDDDMYHRTTFAKLKIQRYPGSVARYVKIRHGRDKGNPVNPLGGLGLKAREDHYATEGLNTVQYQVNETRDLPLYTWLHINIINPVYQAPNVTKTQKTRRFR